MRRLGADSFSFVGFAGYTADGGVDSCFVDGVLDR